MDYDGTEGVVDNMDKLVTAHSYRRGTLHWPLVIFFDIYGNLCVQHLFHLDGTETRAEQREAPEETPLLE